MTRDRDPIVIVSAVRTPLGRFLGDLAPMQVTTLGAHVIRAALERANIAPDRRMKASWAACFLRDKDKLPPGRQHVGQVSRMQLVPRQ